jgi:hypothetical protein
VRKLSKGGKHDIFYNSGRISDKMDYIRIKDRS